MVLAFRRSGDERLVCLYNLSAETVKIGVAGEGEIALSQAATRRKDRLELGPNGFALLIEGEGGVAVTFRGRAVKRAA